LIAEAKGDFGGDGRQRLVVQPGPVHRIGSLMEEKADLTNHMDHICNCLDVIEALKLRSQLTPAEEQRARSYLALHEKPWPNPKVISDSAVLYMDDLAVTYLHHLGLLHKLKAAGFVAIIPQRESHEGDALLPPWLVVLLCAAGGAALSAI
jgi:hypothetical protein